MNKEIMKAMGFEKEIEEIEKGNCPLCKKKITGFNDELSLKEFKISGMCQDCQNSVFGGGK